MTTPGSHERVASQELLGCVLETPNAATDSTLRRAGAYHDSARAPSTGSHESPDISTHRPNALDDEARQNSAGGGPDPRARPTITGKQKEYQLAEALSVPGDSGRQHAHSSAVNNVEHGSSQRETAIAAFSTGHYDMFDMNNDTLQRILQPSHRVSPRHAALYDKLRQRQGRHDGYFYANIDDLDDGPTTGSGSGAASISDPSVNGSTIKGYARMYSTMKGFRAQPQDSPLDIGFTNLRETSSIELSEVDNSCLLPDQIWDGVSSVASFASTDSLDYGKFYEEIHKERPTGLPGFTGEPSRTLDPHGSLSYRLIGNIKIFEQPLYVHPADGGCIFRGLVRMNIEIPGARCKMMNGNFWLLRSIAGTNRLNPARPRRLEPHEIPSADVADADANEWVDEDE